MKEIDPHNPIDSTAKRVVSKVGHQQVSFIPADHIYSMVPLPTRQFNGPKKDDLTGYKSGRYTVVGCALFMPKNFARSTNNTRWVVKCTCGRYAMLTTKAVKKNSPETMCNECQKTVRNRSRDSAFLNNFL